MYVCMYVVTMCTWHRGGLDNGMYVCSHSVYMAQGRVRQWYVCMYVVTMCTWHRGGLDNGMYVCSHSVYMAQGRVRQ